MIAPPLNEATGLLLSGGLDSAVLLGHLVETGHRVQPIYIRAGFVWQEAELHAARHLVREMSRHYPAGELVGELVVLDMPVADLYDDHWSITGKATPGYDTADQAVYLPGHNMLLLVKAAIWCRLRGITSLALACLATNPFADASAKFFESFQAALGQAIGAEVEFVRPFHEMSKRQVMQLGRHGPLEHTFSCLAPVDGRHCGRCNKCAERQTAFRHLSLSDPTRYASACEDSDGKRR